ncbi:MAG TPA: zf-HC2 domain-containing protein [Pyrinomonadaceae bacterium]|jgi:anti-sigma factor RsiW
MKCQEVSIVLADYFDGELAERHSQTVAAHLAACADCAAAYAELEREQELFMRYERDVEVTPQLWHAVAARIAAEQAEPDTVAAAAPLGARLRGWLAGALTVPRFSPALTAALVLVAIALTAGAMRLMNKGAGAPVVATVQTPAPAPATNANANSPAVGLPSAPVERDQQSPKFIAATERPQSQTPPAPKRRAEKHDKLQPANEAARIEEAKLQTPPTPREQTAEDLVRDAAAKYQKAIEILARDVDKRRSRFDAETLARFDDTLKALDRTIAETRRAALGQGNSDPVAVQYMLTAYEKKVEVLREMARN